MFFAWGILCGCQFVHEAQKVEELKEELVELQETSSFFPAEDLKKEIEEKRDRFVELAKSESEIEMDLFKKTNEKSHLEKAQYFLHLAQEVSSMSFAIVDKELQWNWKWTKDWAWKDGLGKHSYNREAWNVWKIACPALWPWTIGENLTCAGVDFFFHWSIERKPFGRASSCDSNILSNFESAIADLKHKESEDPMERLLQGEAQKSYYNVEVRMTYYLEGTEDELKIYEMAVSNHHIPGEKSSFFGNETFEEIWEKEVLEKIAAIRLGTQQAYLVTPQMNIQKAAEGGLRYIEVSALGFVPYENNTLVQFMRDIQRQDTSDDQLTITLSPFDPSSQDTPGMNDK